MTGVEGEARNSEFERRTRELLLESAERLPGSIRSRLTQARYAALAAHQSSMQSPSLVRRWMPAGAVAGVVDRADQDPVVARCRGQSLRRR